MNISIYKNSKKVLDKDIKLNAKAKEQLLMFSVSPFVLKTFFKIVAAYPILIKELPTILKMSSENALEFIGYLEYLIMNGLL